MKLDATKSTLPDWHKHLFPCDCGESHFLELSWSEDPDDDFPGYLDVTQTIWSGGIWDRIKAAGKVLLGRRHYFGGVVLDEETTDHLIESLNEQREAAKKGKERENAEVQQAN
jgi:hypothetical protein